MSATQLDAILKKEQKLIQKQDNILKAKTGPQIDKVIDKIKEKIPAKLMQGLEVAFFNGFKLIFEKGSGVIEKTYDKKMICEDYEINHYAVTNHPSKRRFRNMDKTAGKNQTINAAATTAIGTGLGLLGIGLPDIPVFISILLRQLYQTALSYGFDYESDEEKVYILSLIRTAIADNAQREELHEQVSLLARDLNQGVKISYVMDTELHETATMLAEAMLTAKFIQGIPIVGAVGGITNNVMINKISKYAKLQYKKRYLLL